MRSIQRSLVLAIDQGTTSTRCMTFDSKGFIVHAAATEFPQIYPHAGWVEHDPESIFQSVVACLDGLGLEETDTVSAVGITNQRETIVAWDRNTGRSFYNAVVWLDTRTDDLVRQAVDSSSLGAMKYHSITGLPLSTYFSSMKIKWLIDNVPEVSGALNANTCCFGTIDSYLTYRLTNGSVHVTDCANASRYNLMDLSTRQWSSDICSELGIPLESLPRIVSNSELVGEIDASIVARLGKVPITSLIGDQHAALLGHGCMSSGECKITYGTGSFLLMNTGSTPIPSRGGLLTTIGFQLGPQAEPIFALEGSVASAGRSVKWAKDNLRIGNDMKEFNEIAASVEDTCGVTFVPAFSGLFAPYWRDDARAVIVGMSLRSNYRHIARAILEATAVQCAEVIKLLEAEGQVVESVVTDGGMSGSDLLMQIQADLLNREIKRTKMAESTAFGAAYAAGLAIGFWEGRVVRAIVNEHDSFYPAMSEEVRVATFVRWDDAVTRSFNLSKFAGPDTL